MYTDMELVYHYKVSFPDKNFIKLKIKDSSSIFPARKINTLYFNLYTNFHKNHFRNNKNNNRSSIEKQQQQQSVESILGKATISKRRLCMRDLLNQKGYSLHLSIPKLVMKMDKDLLLDRCLSFPCFSKFQLTNDFTISEAY